MGNLVVAVNGVFQKPKMSDKHFCLEDLSPNHYEILMNGLRNEFSVDSIIAVQVKAGGGEIYSDDYVEELQLYSLEIEADLLNQDKKTFIKLNAATNLKIDSDHYFCVQLSESFSPLQEQQSGETHGPNSQRIYFHNIFKSATQFETLI